MRGLGRSTVLPPAACPLPFTLCPYLFFPFSSINGLSLHRCVGLPMALYRPCGLQTWRAIILEPRVYLLQVCSSYQALSYHNFT